MVVKASIPVYDVEDDVDWAATTIAKPKMAANIEVIVTILYYKLQRKHNLYLSSDY